MQGITNQIGSFLTDSLGAPVDNEIAGMILVIAAIAFVWGVVYHYARERQEGSGESRF